MSQLIGGIQKVGEKVLGNPVGKFLLMAGVSGVLAVMSHIPSVLGTTSQPNVLIKTGEKRELALTQEDCNYYGKEILKQIRNVQGQYPKLYQGKGSLGAGVNKNGGCVIDFTFPTDNEASAVAILDMLNSIKVNKKPIYKGIKRNKKTKMSSAMMVIPNGSSIQEIANLGTTQLVSDETPSAELVANTNPANITLSLIQEFREEIANNGGKTYLGQIEIRQMGKELSLVFSGLPNTNKGKEEARSIIDMLHKEGFEFRRYSKDHRDLTIIISIPRTATGQTALKLDNGQVIATSSDARQALTLN